MLPVLPSSFFFGGDAPVNAWELLQLCAQGSMQAWDKPWESCMWRMLAEPLPGPPPPFLVTTPARASDNIHGCSWCGATEPGPGAPTCMPALLSHLPKLVFWFCFILAFFLGGGLYLVMLKGPGGLGRPYVVLWLEPSWPHERQVP